MMKTNHLRGSTRLEAISTRLASWRAEHGGRGRRIPEELWAEAGSVALVVGIEETAAALGLRKQRLQGFAIELEGTDGGDPATEPSFVELSGASLCRPGVTIEMENRRGDRFRVQVEPSAIDWAALTRAFLEVGG